MRRRSFPGEAVGGAFGRGLIRPGSSSPFSCADRQEGAAGRLEWWRRCSAALFEAPRLWPQHCLATLGVLNYVIFSCGGDLVVAVADISGADTPGKGRSSASLSPHVVVVNSARPRRGLLGDFFWQLYSYREYLQQSIRRDLGVKYKRSYLGYLWTMLHPLGMMLIISMVLSHVVRVPMKDYAVFFLSGVIAWNYFNSTAMMSLNNIRANARLFSQVAVPRYIFIVSITLSNMVNLLLACVPLMVVMLVVGHEFTLAVLALPLIMLPLYLVTVGVSLVLAVSNVFFEDTLHLSEVGMQALYFMCPILYAREFIPVWLCRYLEINPLFLQIEFFRGLFYGGTLPSLELYFFNLALSLLVLLIGLAVFRRSEDKFLYFI